jgi:hypothetical protein
MGVVVLAELVLGIDAQEPLLVARQMVQRLAKGRLPFGSRVLRVLLKFFCVEGCLCLSWSVNEKRGKKKNQTTNEGDTIEKVNERERKRK